MTGEENEEEEEGEDEEREEDVEEESERDSFKEVEFSDEEGDAAVLEGVEEEAPIFD